MLTHVGELRTQVVGMNGVVDGTLDFTAGELLNVVSKLFRHNPHA